MTRDDASAAVCVDVGSTWTKAVLVRSDGALAGFAEHPTTVTDVLAGVDEVVRQGAADPVQLRATRKSGSRGGEHARSTEPDFAVDVST